jgi:hypothetical protein
MQSMGFVLVIRIVHFLHQSKNRTALTNLKLRQAEPHDGTSDTADAGALTLEPPEPAAE